MGISGLVKPPISRSQNAQAPAYSVQMARRPDPWYYPVFLYLYAAVVIPYLVWRFQIINWQVWYGPAAYIAELYGVVMTFTYLWMCRDIYLPVHRDTKFNHTVDALIPTLAEPLSILEPTVIGAMRIRGVRRVLVLDDGCRPEVRAMARRLGVDYYPRSSSQHAKAGNLNNGLRFSDAEFVISIDADHIPLPQFLERTLGYFDDPRLAFVQSPQTYYNTDSFLFRRARKGLWSEQCMFYDMIQPAKNRWNSAFFVGTSAILRRRALDSVGGFATGTATEDIHTSLRLHARGWKSVFVPEVLALGLEADSLKEFYKQRRRWAAGSLGLLFRSPDSPLKAKGLSWQQRLNYLNATLAHLQGVQKLFFFMVPAICAITLVGPITISFGYFNLIFIGFLLLAVGSTAMYARGTYHPIYSEAYGLANMMASLGGIKGIIKVQRKFAVSQKLAPRAERTWLKGVFWALLLFGLMALTRDLYLINHHAGHTGLLVSSLIFLDLNLIFLISFFAYLLAYETRTDPPHSLMEPHAKYAHIAGIFGRSLAPESVIVAQDYNEKTIA